MGMGDEIMVTGCARILQQTDSRKVRVLDRHGKARYHPMWYGNPRIATKDEKGDFQPLQNCPGIRPYIQEKQGERWVWKKWPEQYGGRVPRGELYLDDEEKMFGVKHAGCIILEPNLKVGASPNKDWGWIRWNKLAWILAKRGHRCHQVGPRGTRLLEGVNLIETADFRQACAVLSTAHMAVLHEGGLHHAAAAFSLPAVVIFGGYIMPEQTGYEGHDNIAVEGRGCGNRTPCGHCKKSMARFEPEFIYERFTTMMENTNGTR